MLTRIRKLTYPSIVLLALLGHGQVYGAEAATADPDHSYILGVFPHLPPRELEKVFAPMAADLGKVLGRDVRFRSSTTYEKFSEHLHDGKYDIAFIQPFDYVAVAGNGGYVPAATRTQRLSAIIVTKNDSPLVNMESLKDKRVSLPPESAAVSILTRNHLIRNNLTPGKDVILSHHRSHVSCMQKVLIGETDACGTAAPAVRYFQKRMKVELKTIARTMDIPHTLFVMHTRLPERERQIIKQRILGWGESESGRKLLERGSLKPFVNISDSDYDVVREIIKNQ